MGVEILDVVVAQSGEFATAYDVKSMLAVIVAGACATDIEVFKHPMGLVYQDAFDLRKCEPHRARLGRAEHNGGPCRAAMAQPQFCLKWVQPRRDHDARAWLCIQQGLANRLRTAHWQQRGGADHGVCQCPSLLAFAQVGQGARRRCALVAPLRSLQWRQENRFQFVVALQPLLEIANELVWAAVVRLIPQALDLGGLP